MLKEFIQNIKIILITVVITLLVIAFVAQTAVTCGSSMYPTLEDKDLVLMEKVSRYFNALDRYDVVILNSNNEYKQKYIKRIIGLPGETVLIDKYGDIYINGELLEDDIYGYEKMEDSGIAIEGITLGEDEYFVLGDNRNNSLDSRFKELGPVNIKDIQGRVMFGIWPIQKIK